MHDGVRRRPAGGIRRLARTAHRSCARWWELKRLWVDPDARGLGLGRLLTEAVLDRARTAGRRAIYLDTAPQSMGAAYRMYLALGFTPCERYNDNPVDGLAYLVKHL